MEMFFIYLWQKTLFMNFENIKNILLFVNYIKFDPQSIVYFLKKKFFQFISWYLIFITIFALVLLIIIYLFFLLKFFIY